MESKVQEKLLCREGTDVLEGENVLRRIYFGKADSSKLRFVASCGFERRFRNREVNNWSISCRFGEDSNCKSSFRVDMLELLDWFV